MDKDMQVQFATSESTRRRITLDPLREKILQVPAREVETTAPCGFRQEWVSGEHDETDFRLDVGAGGGSPWLTFEYRNRGYCIDIRDILEALFAFADEGE